MQFKFVAGANECAVASWRWLGFEIVGCLPLAFRQPVQDHVDARVWYRTR